MDFDAFEGWLGRKYRPSTASTYRATVERAYRRIEDGGDPEHREIHALRAYMRFLRESRRAFSGVDERVRVWVTDPPLAPRARRPVPVEPFAPEDWTRLVKLLAEDPEREARVLEIQAVTALRVGDVLRLERPAVQHAVPGSSLVPVEIKGGAIVHVPTRSVPWKRLERQWRGADAPTLAHWISPAATKPNEAAYIAVRTHFRRIAAYLGLRGRWNLHRIRHTVSNRAIERAGGDVRLAQRMLGHTSIATTQRYLYDRALDQRLDELQFELYEETIKS